MMKITFSKPSLLRDFAVFAALIIMGLSFFCLWVTYETYLDHSKSIVNELETEATRIDRAMILDIEHSSYLLEALGRQISHMNVNDLNSIALLLRSFDTTATVHHVFSWIDENQNNVVSSNKGVHPKPIDVSDRDFVKKAIAEPWRIHIGRPIQGRVSEKWVLPVALGITDITGKYLGTILISMDIDTITEELHKAVHDSGISFAIYSKTILLLTQNTENDKSPSLQSYADKLRFVDFNAQPSGLLSQANVFDDRSRYVYYEVSADYPYIILLGFNNTTDATSIRALLMPRLLEVFFVGAFMLGILWLVKARIITPVAELSAIAGGIIRGEPYVPPAHNSAYEVVELGERIKGLSNYLSETRRIQEEKETKNLMLNRGKEAAELSNKIKVEFLTAMSHELRTPLNTIVGFSEIMKNQLYGPLENTQYWQYAQDIHQAAQHLQSLIDDVLALSNAEAGMLELQEKPVDIRFVLNKCLRMVSEKLAERKLHVEIKMPDAMPRLLVDELRLKQIVINLILNAASHSIEDSHIIVEAYLEKDKQDNESYCLSFIDFGSKNSGAIKPTTKNGARKSDLSNLGIPLTKALVAMHQAVLEIKSPPGKPTSVIVRFMQERIVY